MDTTPPPTATIDRPDATARRARVPEAVGRRRLIRASALVALVVGAVYLTWRVTSTLSGDALGLSLLLWTLELHAFLGLGLFTFSLWDVDGRPPPPAELPDLRVAVLIPTYDEPVEVLLPTVAAAVALRPVHETWVLDDGHRPAVAELATRLGARYLTRPEHVHAKAGNLNHALGVVDADVVAVLDADHVAAPGFLERTLPHFHDPAVALVQTPQDFYNESSFEHVHRRARRRDAADRDLVYTEQSLFYREIQPGKHRWNGAFWCGTGAVVRTAALGSVGGVATSSVTEDIQTTIRMHRDGWRTVYHDEVLARGLAAATAAQYALQRRRWCTGAMQVLRQERPLRDDRLTLPQRLTYAATLLGWFDALRVLGFLVLPPLVLLTGSSPIDAPLPMFAALFGASLVLQQHALWRLGRGRMRPVPAAIFDLARLGPTLGAIVIGLTGRSVGFAVTPKGRTTDARSRVATPPLLAALLAVHVLALAWYVASLSGLTPTSYAVPGVAHGAAGWAVLNGGLVVLAVTRVRSQRFAAERRASHRFSVRAHGRLGAAAADVTDLSLTGAQVVVAAEDTPAPGSTGTLTVVLREVEARFAVTVRSARTGRDGATRVGLAFDPDQLDEQARLALGLFAAGTDVVTPMARPTPAPVPAAGPQPETELTAG